MSLASLAAYSSSDEEEASDNDTVGQNGSACAKNTSHTNGVPVPSTVDSIVDDFDVLDGAAQCSSGASGLSLPAVKRNGADASQLTSANDVLDDVPLASSLPQPKKPVVREKVRIFLPSIEEGDDDEENVSPAKKIRPASRGSGLFAVLPPPKRAVINTRSSDLVPQSVSRPAAKKPQPSKTPQPPALPLPKPSAAPSLSDSDDETDEAPSSDFFSLASKSSDSPPYMPVVHSDTYAANDAGSNWHTGQQMATPSTAVGSSLGDTLVGPARPSEQELQCNNRLPTADDMVSSDQIQQEALLRLRGRRERADESDAAVISVCQDDIVPDRADWQRQHQLRLAAEAGSSVQRRPQKSADDPSSQQRRKHQITYLAHQAKEREIELQSEWSQNRATKQVYRNKYGF